MTRHVNAPTIRDLITELLDLVEEDSNFYDYTWHGYDDESLIITINDTTGVDILTISNKLEN